MNVIVFLLMGVLFVGSFLLFGYAFLVGGVGASLMFTLGIIAISVSMAVPFHLLGDSAKY